MITNMVIKIYRASRWLHEHKVPYLPWLLKVLNRVLFGVVLPPTAKLGRNVLLSYQGLGTVIHRHAVVGDGAIIGTGEIGRASCRERVS
jgi:serine O-acetyltransferase